MRAGKLACNDCARCLQQGTCGLAARRGGWRIANILHHAAIKSASPHWPPCLTTTPCLPSAMPLACVRAAPLSIHIFARVRGVRRRGIAAAFMRCSVEHEQRRQAGGTLAKSHFILALSIFQNEKGWAWRRYYLLCIPRRASLTSWLI